MSELEVALNEATARVSMFLKQDQTAFDQLFQALALVSPLLPVRDPDPSERAALADYRVVLEQLPTTLDRMTERLRSQRSIVQEQVGRLKVMSLYQRTPGA